MLSLQKTILNKYSKLSVLSLQNVDNGLTVLKKLQNFIKWNDVSESKYLKSETIECFEDCMNFGELIKNNFNVKFIEKYKDRIRWEYVSCDQILSEEFIENFEDGVKWLVVLGFMAQNPFKDMLRLTKSKIQKK